MNSFLCLNLFFAERHSYVHICEFNDPANQRRLWSIQSLRGEGPLQSLVEPLRVLDTTRLSPLVSGQQLDYLAETGPPRHLKRRLAVVDSGPTFGIGACLKQEFHSLQILFADRHVQWCVVVDAALMWIGSELQQQSEEVYHVWSGRSSRRGSIARQRRD